jgi:hypothetical protein
MIYSPKLKVLYLAYVKEYTSKLKDQSDQIFRVKKIDCIRADGFVHSIGCPFVEDPGQKGNILKLSKSCQDLIVLTSKKCLRVFLKIEKHFYNRIVDIKIQ